MVTDQNKQVPYPPLDDRWKKEVLTVAKKSSTCLRHGPCSQAKQIRHRKIVYKIYKHQNKGTARQEMMVRLHSHIASPPLLANPVQQLLTTADNCTVGGSDVITTTSAISAARSPPRTNNTS